MSAAGILPGSLAILTPSNHSLSSSRAITGPDLFRPFSISFSFASAGHLASPAIIRMGGGPRTFPGGVSKWQWKRMQAKKAQQLLKARLCRERQLYEMRKRAELKAAISELERPWEVVERAPVLFSASADEQVKVLADRFQRPTGFDMWSDRDGPQLFLSPDDLPSSRFFPKRAVHSLKPYSVVSGNGGGGSDEGDGEMRYDDWIARGAGGIGRGRRGRRVLLDPGKSGDGDTGEYPISHRSDSEHLVAESMEEKKEIAGLLNRHDRNHAPQESDVAGLTMEGDEMAVESSSANGSSSASHLSESELALPMAGGGGFRRRGGRVSRGGNRVSYRSHYVLPVTCSRVKEDEMSRGFDGRHRDSKMDNSIDRLAGRGSRAGRNGNRGSFGSYSTLSVAGSEREGGKFGRRGGHGQNGVSQFSNSKFGVAGSRMDDRGMDESFSRRRGGHGARRGRGGSSDEEHPISYHSDSEHLVAESMEEKKEIAGLLNRHDRNHAPQESDVAGLTTEGDEMAVESSSANGSSSASHLSESELALPDLRLEVREMAGGRGFRRRGGRVSRGGNRVSYRSHYVLRVKEDEMSRGFDGRHRDSKMDNSVDRLAGRGSRAGRNGNRGSFGSYSTLSGAGSEREGGKFGRRGGHGQNGVSQFSNSKFGVAGSRMDDRGMDESFSRRRGAHGARRGRGGFRGSYRPHSELVVDDDYRIGRGTAGDFGDRDGNHRWSRDPSSFDSDHSVARRRTEGDYIAGGFVRHRGRGGRTGNRGVAMSGGVGRGGGRGGYRVSYRSASDLVIAGSRKAREMGMDSRFGGSDQDYKGATRVSLRPTTDLRLEEGRYGRRD